MTVLVTGGAGFIGSHVTERLLADGERVVVADKFNDFYSPAQKRRNIAGFEKNPKATIVEMDITDSRAVERLFAQHSIEKVAHLAAIAGVRYSVEHPKEYFDVNVSGMANLFESSRLHHVSQMVFASTSSVYGNPSSFPTSENDSTDSQLSPYAASKKMGEVLARSYFQSFGLPTNCLRFFTVYGPRNRPDMAVYLFGDAIYRGKPVQMFGDGSSKRDYTFVGDVADAVCKALDGDLGFETINIGNHHPTPLRELIGSLENAFSKKAVIAQKPWPESDIQTTYADVSKAKKLLSWEPKTVLEEGIGAFAQWYLSTDNTLLQDR
ncbi:MAG: SDR family NAD(P)-dependent oxidoreductase [Candidatus Diapherotrites archaeon]|nr:SDR family NAD(P)-dependent oxidoreductase [Candidatus Diapherotrites archaeon]